MKFGDLFLVHIGLPVDSALVAELLREKYIYIKTKKYNKKTDDFFFSYRYVCLRGLI